MAFASAAALAVESTNIVGYTDMQSASFQLITPMFTKIGGGTDFTLADLLPVSSSWNFNSDKIVCYNGALMAFEATYLTEQQAQNIIDDAGLDGVTAEAGWYDTEDVGEWGELGTLRCYNATPIAFGSSGFAIKSSVGVRFSGEVKESPTSVSSGTFQLVGNCSLKNLTLREILPASAAWNFNSDKIIYYNGALMAFEATYLTEQQAQDIIDDAGLDGVTAEAGWYDTEDVGEWGELGTLRCYNATPIPIGSGFAIKSSVGVIIPSSTAEN